MMRTPAWWRTRGSVAWLLAPLGLLYSAGAWIDRRSTKPARAPLPVIAVGNATAGGAGKTPTTIALVKLLQAMGEVPHIISRGYGGTAHTAHRVDAAHDLATSVGDEALLLAAAAPTWVGADRLASSRAAHAAGATLVIADDALQHHALQHDIALLVVDTNYGFGNRLPIPAGPLREPLSGLLKRCHASIAIGGSMAGLPQPCFAASIAPSGDTSFLHGKRWLAFAGIAHPDKFFATLDEQGAHVAQHERFADHAPYTDATLIALRQRAAEDGLHLITTEKDWLRLAPAQRADIACLPVALQFAQPGPLGQWLQDRLIFARSSAK